MNTTEQTITNGLKNEVLQPNGAMIYTLVECHDNDNRDIKIHISSFLREEDALKVLNETATKLEQANKENGHHIFDSIFTPNRIWLQYANNRFTFENQATPLVLNQKWKGLSIDKGETIYTLIEVCEKKSGEVTISTQSYLDEDDASVAIRHRRDELSKAVGPITTNYLEGWCASFKDSQGNFYTFLTDEKQLK